jgi:hypothetical protein
MDCSGEALTIPLAELALDDPAGWRDRYLFINLPFVNIYVQPSLEAIWGMPWLAFAASNATFT